MAVNDKYKIDNDIASKNSKSDKRRKSSHGQMLSNNKDDSKRSIDKLNGSVLTTDDSSKDDFVVSNSASVSYAQIDFARTHALSTSAATHRKIS